MPGNYHCAKVMDLLSKWKHLYLITYITQYLLLKLRRLNKKRVSYLLKSIHSVHNHTYFYRSAMESILSACMTTTLPKIARNCWELWTQPRLSCQPAFPVYQLYSHFTLPPQSCQLYQEPLTPWSFSVLPSSVRQKIKNNLKARTPSFENSFFPAIIKLLVRPAICQGWIPDLIHLVAALLYFLYLYFLGNCALYYMLHSVFDLFYTAYCTMMVWSV